MGQRAALVSRLRAPVKFETECPFALQRRAAGNSNVLRRVFDVSDRAVFIHQRFIATGAIK
jgi:hypothetical protein